MPKKVLSASLLTGGRATLAQAEGKITLAATKADRQEIDTIFALKLNGAADDIPPMSISGSSAKGLIRPGMKVAASNVFQGNAEYSPEKAIDNNADTRWATDAGTRKAWLEIDLGRPLTFARVAIDEAYGQRVQSFELQSKEGNRWKTFYHGRMIGDGFSADFPVVTAQVVRLNVLDASEGPTITEFQLYAPGKK